MVTKARKAAGKRSEPKKPGTASQAQAAPTTTNNDASPSSGEMLRRRYVSLLRCRRMEEQISGSPELAARYDFTVGQEAVAVGAAADLGDGDTLAVSQRNLAALVAAGVTPREILREFQACGCRSTGLLAFSSLSEDPFNTATGIALAHKLAKQGRVVVAIGGDAAEASEAMKLAGSGKLPVIYVVKNSVGEDGAYAPHLKPVNLLSRDGGFPGVIVDGQDVVAVWRVAQESIHRARNGGGPTLIDCRMDRARDPLAHMEHYLRKRSLWDEAWLGELEQKITAELVS